MSGFAHCNCAACNSLRTPSLRAELETERAKSRELAASLVDYQRRSVVLQQERDEWRAGCQHWQAKAADYARERDLARAAAASIAEGAEELTQERDSARGEVLGLLRMLRERGVEV